MTINLTTEELQEHESRLSKWALAFAKALTVSRTEYDPSLAMSYRISQTAPESTVKQWMKENPIPRLIPAVLRTQEQ